MKYTSKEDAEKAKREIQNRLYGEWSYDNSQEIAKRNGVYEFVKEPYVDRMFSSGTLAEVEKLPNHNVLKQRWYDLKAMIKGNLITEWEEFDLVQSIIYDYHKLKKDM